MRILIVDDHPVAREALRSFLEQAGHSVLAEAADGPSAVEAATRTEPDLALVDLYLGDELGYDVCHELIAALPALPVVLVSMDRRIDRDRLVSSGARAFITKDQIVTTGLDAFIQRPGHAETLRLKRP